jgi:uncharacterized protein YerC
MLASAAESNCVALAKGLRLNILTNSLILPAKPLSYINNYSGIAATARSRVCRCLVVVVNALYSLALVNVAI